MRSPFAAAVVSSIFPEVATFSAGTDVDVNSRVHSRAVDLGNEWGIAVATEVSATLYEHRRALKCADLVVAAEEELLPKVSTFPIHGKLTSFNEIALHPDFMPIDPIGTSENEFRVQMSKVSHVAIRSLHKDIYPHIRNSITAVIPISENIFELAFATAVFEAITRDAILIYVDFRAYLNSPPEGISVVRYNPENYDPNFFLKMDKKCIFLPDREVSIPERLYLNRNWISLISEIALQSEVILLTPPRYLETGKVYDSYLASTFANTITVVNA